MQASASVKKTVSLKDLARWTDTGWRVVAWGTGDTVTIESPVTKAFRDEHSTNTRGLWLASTNY